MTVCLSFIVPMYNVEKMISACLTSLIHQTLPHIEIICINDGSTDGTLKIVKRFAKKDKRIRIISKHNEGQGVARNIGIRLAKGHYIAFVDADDYIMPDYAETMYALAIKDNTDLTFCDCVCLDHHTGKLLPPIKSVNNSRLLSNFSNCVFSFEQTKHLYFDQITGVPWAKIYKTSFLRENNLYFPEHVRWEDYPFFYKMYIHVKRANCTPQQLYVYRVNRLDSDCHNFSDKGFAFFKHFEIIEEVLRRNNYYYELYYPFLEKKITGLFYIFTKTGLLARRDFYNRMRLEFRSMNLSEDTLNNLVCSTRATYKFICACSYDVFRVIHPIKKRVFHVAYNTDRQYYKVRLLFLIKFKIQRKQNEALSYLSVQRQ